ncbi:hypothetical protein LCGC14_0627700 [marine sediment metagenome]|uniref:Uncharacterized protein n=1 Tax=marine sediment metagenome TaxID=412755 RepID=A0A0F9R2T6_9ZZZZ
MKRLFNWFSQETNDKVHITFRLFIILASIGLLFLLLLSIVESSPTTNPPQPVDGDWYDYDYAVEHSRYEISLYTGDSTKQYYTQSIIYNDSNVSTRYGYFIYIRLSLSPHYLWHKEDITIGGTWAVTPFDKEVKE